MLFYNTTFLQALVFLLGIVCLGLSFFALYVLAMLSCERPLDKGERLLQQAANLGLYLGLAAIFFVPSFMLLHSAGFSAALGFYGVLALLFFGVRAALHLHKTRKNKELS